MIKIFKAAFRQQQSFRLVRWFSDNTRNIRHSSKMSLVKTHIVQAEKYIALEQYHLADFEIERAASQQSTKEEKDHLLKIRGELEMIKPSRDFKKAISYFDRAIESSGDFSLDAFRHKIICLEEAKMLKDRLESFDTLLSEKKMLPQDFAERAHILFLQQDYEKALKQYERCDSMKLLSEKDMSYLKGVCLMAVGRSEESENQLKIRNALVPTDIQTLQFLFTFNWQRQKYGQAIKRCEQMLKIDPTLQFAFAYKAMCLYALQKWPEVIKTLEKIDEDQGSSDKYFLKGMSYYKLDKLKEATTDLEEMLQRGVDRQSRKIQALFTLADIHRHNKNYTKAQEYYAEAFKTDAGQALHYLPGIKSNIRYFVETGEIQGGQALYTEAASIHSASQLEDQRILLAASKRPK